MILKFRILEASYGNVTSPCPLREDDEDVKPGASELVDAKLRRIKMLDIDRGILLLLVLKGNFDVDLDVPMMEE